MLDWAKWLWGVLEAAFAHAPILAGVLGSVLGMALSEFIAQYMPPTMNADYAKRVVRLLVLGITACLTFWLFPTLVGLFIALITGMVSPWMRELLVRAIYARWPKLEPPALVPCVFDKPDPAVKP